MAGFSAPGAKTYFSDSADHILDVSDGLDFLNPKGAVALLKKIMGDRSFKVKSVKHEWSETALATRGETMTMTNVATLLTVANAYQYQIQEALRCENEVMIITAINSATTITVSRGAAGTSAVAHTAKLMYSIGSADAENSDAPSGITDTGDRLYNYVQTFTRAVEMSTNEIAQLSTDGNPFDKQTERRFIEINQQLARALFYGVRYEDTSNKRHYMGGLKQFVTTNVSNVAGALTIAAIDAQLLNIILAGGGDNLAIVTSPYQKQKLDALDANKQMLGKKEHTGGNLITNTWQSGIVDEPIEVFTDQSILTDELWIVDMDNVDIGPLSNNGVNGGFHIEDAKTPGKDGEKSVIRGKYTMEVGLEKSHAYLYGLS